MMARTFRGTSYDAFGLRAGAIIAVLGGRCAEGTAGMADGSITRIIGILEKMAALHSATAETLSCLSRTVEEYVDGEPDEAEPWQEFVDAHPELRQGRLEFTDDDLVAAVAEAKTQWQSQLHSSSGQGIWAASVACVLRGVPVCGLNPKELRPTQSDVIRVGQRLGRLARQGRIMLVSKPYEGRRYAPLGDVDVR